jgi:hypothetical protein
MRRISRDQNSKSQSKSATTASPLSTLFNQPQVLEGEDAVLYQELLARIRAAVDPADTIEEILIVDVASLEWEALRWRRLKKSLLRSCQLKVLQDFLATNLDAAFCSDKFAKRLIDRLQYVLSGGRPDDHAAALVDDYMAGDRKAINEVDGIFAVHRSQALLRNYFDEQSKETDELLRVARFDKAQEVVRKFAQQEPGTIALVDKLLATAATTLDALTAEKLLARMGTRPEGSTDNSFGDYIEMIERFDRLTLVAESRRNAALREIDRRRTGLGATRRAVQEIEDTDYEVIKTAPVEGKE